MLKIRSFIPGRSENKDGEGTDNKIRYLAKIDDDILAVFVVISNEINEMYLADNANLERCHTDSLIRLLEPKQINHNEKMQNDAKNKQESTLLGKPK